MTYDAIIVGAGPGGGSAARALTEAGLQVLVLDAGPSARSMALKRLIHRARLKSGFALTKNDRNRQPVQSRCYAWEVHPASFVDDFDNPYGAPKDRPFLWIRSRQEGGRMAVPRHGLQFYRLSDLDFKAASRDGFGVDWPIGYSDLAPYYERVERLIDLQGNADGIAHLPDPIAGPRRGLTAIEQHLRDAIVSRWPDRHLIVRRTAKPPVPITAARATGHLTYRSNAIARELSVDPKSGEVSGVNWLENGKAYSARAHIVVLAASAIESTRLLLNSRSPRHPDGIGNSSGTLGCFLMDHTNIELNATRKSPSNVGAGEPQSFAYIPQFRNVDSPTGAFLRGYGVQVWTKGNDCTLTIRGEMLPRATNRVTIDTMLKDKWGIPVPRIECEYSDNERRQTDDAMAECYAMLDAAGYEVRGAPLNGAPGLAIHECGTARMGSDPRTSVLNRHSQCWDAPNVFVVDAASFASQGVQNPTLTIMALALRASEYIVRAMSHRELATPA